MKYKSLVDKWAPVLESDIGDQLDEKNKVIFSLLLENQTKMNKGYLPESSQLDSSMSVYQQYALPLIRRSYQHLLPMTLCEVSVGINNTGTYQLKRIINNKPTMVNGAIMLDNHRIKSHYTTELRQDIAACMGVDVEALMLEALQYEQDQYVNRKLINSMKKCATNIELGGIAERDEDLSFGGMDGDEDYLYERITERIVSDAIDIRNKTEIAPGNFVICSCDILPILARSHRFKMNSKYTGDNAVKEAGTLLTNIGEIKIIIDITTIPTYVLVGLYGMGPGESGIAFIPSIPYNFNKSYDPSNDSDRIMINSVWALVDNTEGSGSFYRYTEYSRVKEAIEIMNKIM